MSFGADHYVPVLKIKRGEMKALELVSPSVRARITPLLEIVEWRQDKKPTLMAHLETVFRHPLESLRGYAGCFLDARELEKAGPSAADTAFARAIAMGMRFVPVTGITRTADTAAVLKIRERGLAIRLTRDEFETGGLAARVRAFMSQHHLTYEATDLIIDLGPVEEMISEGVAAFAAQFLMDVPETERWRTLTISASAFPMSMGIVERKSHTFVDRAEWLAWRDHLRNDKSLRRLPTYSDCGIQHPAGVEGFDPVRMQVSAAIRYTLSEQWLLVKGESTRRTSAKEQFPQLAKHLVYGHHRQHFAGERHCAGCASIKQAADGRAGLGSAEVWRRIGTTHHIETVTQALTALAGS